jgi:RimJ/RimL family protein N-acetyltransferase
MLRLRPYKDSDAAAVLSWCRDEVTFRRWTAGVLGPWPLTAERFSALGELARFTLLDETVPCGFFTMRNPTGTPDEVRFGFVIVDPDRRGRGYGSGMLRLGLRYARDIYGAKRVSLAVFEDNEAALRCYRSVGFCDDEDAKTETYTIDGQTWKCRTLAIDLV